MSTHSSQIETSARKRRPHLAVRLVRAAAIGYLVLLLLLLVIQKYLIFPGTLMERPPLNLPKDGTCEQLALKTHDGSELAAAFYGARTPGQPKAAGPMPTILYFYGNASTLAASSFEIELFRDCGANVLVADYPGYGMSPGSPSEAGCYATADALWDVAMTRPDVDKERIVVVGWSLGGAVAIDLACRRPAAAIMTLSAFTSLDAMARRQMPYMPTDLLLRHHFTNIHKLSGLRAPIAIAHGDADRIVPFEMARELYDASWRSPFRSYLQVNGSGHDDIYNGGYREIGASLRKLIALTDKRPH